MSLALQRNFRAFELWQASMFAFYSNRVGCLGSIVISLILSVILFAVMAMFSGRF